LQPQDIEAERLDHAKGSEFKYSTKYWNTLHSRAKRQLLKVLSTDDKTDPELGTESLYAQ
jgi:hypothetical protein